MNASFSILFRHPELVEGSVRPRGKGQTELILRQAQDDDVVKRNFFVRHRRIRGFTLLEMMITLAIFILLASAVFVIMSGVLQSTATLQDNSNRRDQIGALTAFMKNKLGGMPAASTLTSYQRGDGEGLTQNGIIFGTANLATVIDAKVQPNGYYALRLATLPSTTINGQPQDPRPTLQQLVTTDDPTLVWTLLIPDVKTLSWKFQDLNVTDWVTLWAGSSKPNLVEFSMQTAGDLQPTTIDFWIPKIEPVNVSIQRQPKTP